MLARDGAEGIEVFMVARHKAIRFAGGALVFPGGKVDAEDRDPSAREVHDDSATLDEEMFALHASAVREVFEETGVLLACDAATGEPVSGETTRRIADAHREPLLADAITMADIARREGLRLSVGALARFAHWVTPAARPVRFDTHFFLTAVPPDHAASHDGSETVDSVWINAARAEATIIEQGFSAMFPTMLNLALLAESATVSEAIAAARRRSIACVTPDVRPDADGNRWVHIPDNAGYRTTVYPFQKDWIKAR